MFPPVLLLAMLRLGAVTSDHTGLRAGACPDSFPLARPAGHTGLRQRRERFLAADETGGHYAPLCPDRRRLDLRRLQECPGVTCWVEKIQQCTYECTWAYRTREPTRRRTSKPTNRPTPQSTPPPTPGPTPLPTPEPTVPLVETEVPLLLLLRGLDDQYTLGDDLITAIVRHLFDKLEVVLQDLTYALDLLALTYHGSLPGRPHDVPLLVRMKAPPDIADFMSSFLVQILQDSSEEIMANLKEMDEEAFMNLTLSFETYDPDDMIEEESTSGTPSASPTSERTPELESGGESSSATSVIKTMLHNLPSWIVWLILALMILSCCVFCVCCCRRRGKVAVDRKEVEQELQSTLFMQHCRELRRQQAINQAKKPRHSNPLIQERSRRDLPPELSQSRRPRRPHRPTRRDRVPSYANKRRNMGSIQKIKRSHRQVLSRRTVPAKQTFALEAETAVSAFPQLFAPPRENSLALCTPEIGAPPKGVAPSLPRAPALASNSNRLESEGEVHKSETLFADAALMDNVRHEGERTQRILQDEAFGFNQREIMGNALRCNSNPSNGDPNEE